MKALTTAILCLLVRANTIAGVKVENSLVVTSDLLRLVQKAVHASLIAYDRQPTAGEHFDMMQYWRVSPDQTIVAASEGYCYAAFRGTNPLSASDLRQNLQWGNEQVCAKDSSSTNATADEETCCNVERGFWNGYNTNYRGDFELSLSQCVASCRNSTTDDGCPVVLTGHSQGGAIATVAALYLSQYEPTLITFGQPPTIDAPCALLNSEKYYRFENSRARLFIGSPTYDPIPYSPIPTATQYGHQIMLGDDGTGVAYIGKDTAVEFGPADASFFGFVTHYLESPYVGYISRIESLSAPVRTSGFANGAPCSIGIECNSKRCVNSKCVRSLQ